jgi:predicted phosphodiesterase
MQTISINLGKDIDRLELHILADLHIGDPHCDINDIKKRVELIKENKNAYVILNGDLINNATCQSVSDTYSEQMSPMEQLKMVIDMFKPIKDRIICAVSGNHENRTYKTDGIDLTRLIMREFGLEDRYSMESMVVFLSFGEQSRNKSKGRQQLYTIYTTHGTGGGKKAGGKINSLMDLAGIIDTDIYIHSHTHLPIIAKQDYFRTTLLNRSVKKVTKLFVNTAASLDYGGYGEMHGFNPASKDSPVIYLNGTKRGIAAKL